MASATSYPQAHILGVPTEIRLKIYEHYLQSLSAYAHVDDHPYCALNTVLRPAQHLNLLLAHRTFNVEAASLVLSYVKFTGGKCGCYTPKHLRNTESFRTSKNIRLAKESRRIDVVAQAEVDLGFVQMAKRHLGDKYEFDRFDMDIVLGIDASSMGLLFVDGREHFEKVSSIIRIAGACSFGILFRIYPDPTEPAFDTATIYVQVDQHQNTSILHLNVEDTSRVREPLREVLISEGIIRAGRVKVIEVALEQESVTRREG